MTADKLGSFFASVVGKAGVGLAVMCQVLGTSAVICMAATLFAMRVAAAQTPAPATTAADLPKHGPSIRVRSNLVLVPVFVFPNYGLERVTTVEEEECSSDDYSKFLSLSPDQVFSPRGCGDRGVRGLTLDDFQLFDDGELQKIEAMEKEDWPVSVRDNRSWHGETSDTPAGIWSTTDLDHHFRPWEGCSYYLLRYVPIDTREGCHRIRVEVRRPKDAEVFARDEYCEEQTPSDLLRGTKMAQKLTRQLAEKGRGKIPLFLQAGTFRNGAAQQRVDVVLEFPWDQLHREWGVNSRLRASIGVLGAVYAKDGTVVTRFSDLLWPSHWPTKIQGQGDFGQSIDLSADPSSSIAEIKGLLSRWDPAWLPTRYETQFELSPGEYDLRVVLNDGEKFGRAETPLTIENYSANSLNVGSVFLCKRYRDAHVAAIEAAAANIAPQYVPLVSKGIRVTPAGDTNFRAGEPLMPYFEIYTPQGTVEPAPQIQARFRIVDAKSGSVVKDFSPVDVASYARSGTTTIPIAREVPIAVFHKGQYRLEVQASDSAGRSTPWRSATFKIE